MFCPKRPAGPELPRAGDLAPVSGALCFLARDRCAAAWQRQGPLLGCGALARLRGAGLWPCKDGLQDLRRAQAKGPAQVPSTMNFPGLDLSQRKSVVGRRVWDPCSPWACAVPVPTLPPHEGFWLFFAYFYQGGMLSFYNLHLGRYSGLRGGPSKDMSPQSL